ncbi:DUF4252 domain-containing protein [Robertkochia aurantiaca]|uniref:DUF4252 domain-containing protein n=1 Tax=Robertkochia aurantiaca TaxID=2873700 RepID=UPI001CCA5737|nr:DUF4252 domain-containing protein [Robertkochia sp. 3YJGBD-33]
MKKLILAAIVAILPLAGFGQSIFDKYENDAQVTYVAMQPKMFQMLGKMSVSTEDPEAQEFFELVNNITSFKVMTTENKEIAADMENWVVKHLNSSSFEELMRVRDGDSNVRFYVKEGRDENHVKELLMHVTDIGSPDVKMNGKMIESVLLSLTGDIDLRKIASLTNKMDLPGGDQLGKAGQEKN